MTTKPDPAAVIANLEALESKLFNAFKAKASHAKSMQDRYTVALTAVANFLEQSGIDEEIGQKFAELSSHIHEGTVPFLCPPKVSGRAYDIRVVWNYRAYVVIGLECILRSGKMKQIEAVKYIAKNYPDLNRLKRNPSDSLEKSILSWRRYFAEEKGHEYIRAEMNKFYQPCDPPEMFNRGERALKRAAEITAQAAL